MLVTKIPWNCAPNRVEITQSIWPVKVSTPIATIVPGKAYPVDANNANLRVIDPQRNVAVTTIKDDKTIITSAATPAMVKVLTMISLMAKKSAIKSFVATELMSTPTGMKNPNNNGMTQTIQHIKTPTTPGTSKAVAV